MVTSVQDEEEAARMQEQEAKALREATRVLPPPPQPTPATIDHQPYYA